MPSRATAPFDVPVSWQPAALSAIGSSSNMERGAQHASLKDTKPHRTGTSYGVTVLARCRPTAVNMLTHGGTNAAARLPTSMASGPAHVRGASFADFHSL